MALEFVGVGESFLAVFIGTDMIILLRVGSHVGPQVEIQGEGLKINHMRQNVDPGQ